MVFAYTQDKYPGHDVKKEEKLNLLKCNAENLPECIKNNKRRKDFIVNNIYYDWYFINERYWVNSSSKLFSYNDKIWFIGEEEWKFYVYYDWKKVSEWFDKFMARACCSLSPYTFELFEDWKLFFLFKRWEKFYYWLIDLNEKSVIDTETSNDGCLVSESNLGW